jgi:hypothetical protein
MLAVVLSKLPCHHWNLTLHGSYLPFPTVLVATPVEIVHMKRRNQLTQRITKPLR